MAKQTGLGTALYVGGYDVSGDINAINSISGGNSPLVMTGIKKSAFERQGGNRDGSADVVAYFNPSAGGSRPVLGAMPSTDTMFTYNTGLTIGSSAVSCAAKTVDFSPKRGADGSLIVGVKASANNYGVEWGVMLTADVRTDTATTNGAAVDLGMGSLTFGAQAYLHVMGLTGTNCTVKIQHSTDSGSTDPWADVTGLTSATVTANSWQRLAATGTVKRYVRAVTATTGALTSLSFALMISRNPVAVVF